ncbi:MAG: protein TolR [Amylibacter sp.]|jgi:biopolymer transport protein TolR|nr:protein TolR [Amylibacter sp.]MDB2676435.1 protein TolR [Amylibacter sp.]RZO41798.1 MAG: protein TolR [Paracoccaceae bacterium]|tara:strand:+ start:6191 stop:6664 length:474 start_codon:yes stop_codon:yes gene_type:complete
MGASISPRDGGGGKRRRGHAKNRPMAEINVTPFVDVMLVLLIIFMVAAPMLTVGVPIELPKTAAQPLATEQEEPLTIALSSEGKIVLQNIEIKNENLIEKLVAVAEERTNNKVFLRADASVNYAAVMEVMGALNAAGFNNIGLVTDAGGPKLDGSDP